MSFETQNIVVEQSIYEKCALEIFWHTVDKQCRVVY